ncbi:DUF5686 and carboxypeptidase regulatory-like domain-containing protein [Aquirufa sp. ROCK2-A2]
MRKYLIAGLLINLISLSVYSQSIKGLVKDSKGEILPFATIWIQNLNKGTIANENGQYQFVLGPGDHQVVFRFLGFAPKTVSIHFNKGDEDKELNIVLVEQAVTLQDVKVGGLKEDPAIGIMRRMISMAPFHLKEVSSYSARAYVKGVGKINSMSKIIKWAVGKQMEKDAGIKVGTTYMLEGVNQINFQKPNKIQEKVISNRNNLPAQLRDGALNLRVAQTNFYKPRVWSGIISPVAPNAFSFYQFSYLGSFKLNDLTISKIRVMPKALSDDLFDGTINVVEDTWSIYSFNLNFKSSNAQINFQQQNAQFYGVWMPINYDVRTNFNVMGIEANFSYVTQIKEYNIKVDPAFVVKPQIIEERLEKSLAKEIDKEKIKSFKDAKTAISGDITRKKLKKALKTIEKAEEKEIEEKEGTVFESEYDFEVDSLANLKSEDFWTQERQVPLTNEEKLAYKKADSLYIAGAKKRTEDSLNRLPIFKWSQIITGKVYDFRKKDIGKRISITGISYDFNAVNGNTWKYGFEYLNQFKEQNSLKFFGDLKWAAQREVLNGEFGMERTFQNGRQFISAKLGNSLKQINSTFPISDRLNSFYSFFLNQNFAKYYQKEFVNVEYRNRISSNFLLFFEGEFRNRSAVSNSVEQGVFKNYDKFTPNVAINLENQNTTFSNDQQVYLKGMIQWQPNATFRRYNKNVYLNNSRGLIFRLSYAQALLDNPFKSVELSVTNRLNLNRLGDFRYQLSATQFIEKPNSFLDYTHFKGNEIIFTSRFDFGFKALPYYLYSTSGTSVRGHFTWEPRKFALTQLDALYMYGLRESFTYNALYSKNVVGNKYYHEISYGLDGIGGILGLDLVYPMGNWVPEKFKLLIRVPF